MPVKEEDAELEVSSFEGEEGTPGAGFSPCATQKKRSPEEGIGGGLMHKFTINAVKDGQS